MIGFITGGVQEELTSYPALQGLGVSCKLTVILVWNAIVGGPCTFRIMLYNCILKQGGTALCSL